MSYTRKQIIILISCLSTQFLLFVCVSLPAPFLPKLDESHNVNSDLTGWTLGLLSLVMVILSPIFGKLVPVVSVRTMMVCGTFHCGGSTILFGMLEYVSVPNSSDEGVDVTYVTLAMACRISQAIGAAAVITGGMTCFTVEFHDHTTTVLSYSETICGLGFMCGPAVGSGLFSIGGFMLAFSGVGALLLLSSIVICFTFPPDAGASENDSQTQSSLMQVFANKKVMISIIFTCFIGTLWSSIDPILEPELRQKYGLNEELSALTFLLLSGTYMVAAPAVGKAYEKLKFLNPFSVIVVGFLLQSATFMLMGPSPLLPSLTRPLWLLLFSMGIMGIGCGLLIVSTLAMLSDNDAQKGDALTGMDSSAKALMSGIWSAAYSFGDFLGPTISGVATKNGSFAWTMTYYAVGCSVAAILILSGKFYTFVRATCKLKHEKTVKINSNQDETTPILTA